MATRQKTEFGEEPIRITRENWKQLSEEHSHTTLPENLDKLIRLIAHRCPRPGDKTTFDLHRDYVVVDARSVTEFHFLLFYLVEALLLRQDGAHFCLTVKGWEHYIGPTHGPVTGTCFIAMSFDPALNGAYRYGIHRAVVECGYEPVFMKDVLTNEDINFRILAEIRKAQILVRISRGKGGGVYFEAGFARGLGREVFWTCRADDRKNFHFDTNHFQYVFWNETSDLREQLREKILAVVGPGPHYKSPQGENL
jgi:hypothetical protein